MTDEIPDRNTLARELADVRDEMTRLRQELNDAQTTAVQWAQWAESNADKLNGENYDYEKPDNYDTMLSEANVLMEKLKDHWYDIGYATALRELHAHMDEVLEAWANKQGVSIYGR